LSCMTISPAIVGRAIRMAREAADSVTDRKVLVAGSLPPIFGSYEPQNFQPSRVQDYLEVLVEKLSPFVDIWMGEKLSLIAEAEAVRKAVATSGK
ncbi:homocysteine S-methyltransferase family protein, partial [Rhizobium johnstonii]|uniref:homocysteine S-methyltransferase family protein n=1 Tax=Rhizobium johnstonii TaxID=3019933 RepID=UPI003F9BDF63